MAADLLLVIGLPLTLLLLGAGLLLQNGGRLPDGLDRLRRHQAALWGSGIGLIISLPALRWPLRR